MPPQKIEIFKSLEVCPEENILIHLKLVGKCWQPQGFFPILLLRDLLMTFKELQERSVELPYDYSFCLRGRYDYRGVLPAYQTVINNLDGVRDETGASSTSWALWTRMWKVEEKTQDLLIFKFYERIMLQRVSDLFSLPRTMHSCAHMTCTIIVKGSQSNLDMILIAMVKN